MNLDQVKIAVLMPNFNNASYLKEAIDSVMSQSYTNFELIFVDDGSTDKSIEIVKSYDDSRIKLIRKECNSGIVDSLNRGLEEIETKYFIRMDGDDISALNRFEVLVRYMECHPEVDVCSSAMKYFGASEQIIEFEKSPAQNKANLIFGHTIGHAPSIFRTELFKKNAIHYEDLFWRIEDYLLFYRFKNLAETTSIDQVLYYYRRGEYNANLELELKKNESFKQIYSLILSDLGLEVTAERLEVHIQLSGRSTPSYSLSDYKKHIKVILSANENKASFPSAELKKALNLKMDALYFKLLDRKKGAFWENVGILLRKPKLILYFIGTRRKRI
jgi:glycosyltransferase involved in cell wall biosynthesis